MADNVRYKEIRLDKKLITSVDPAMIADSFQSLKNLRYTDTHIRGIGGMTKVNTSAISTYVKPRSGFHFRKDQPSESHVLLQAYNSGLSSSVVIQNTTAIPNQGNFFGTAIHVDAAGAGRGFFSSAPGGNVAYCNGKESLIWGGTEHIVAGFINKADDDSFFFDYTEQVRNTSTDSEDIAVLNTSSGGIDANTVLCFHFENNVTDSSSSAHSPVNHGGTFSAVTHKFGSYSLSLNGSSAYVSVPDDSDFTASGGQFSIDAWINVDSVASTNPIYYQQTDANNYISFYVNSSGGVSFDIYSGGSAVVSLSTQNSVVSASTWNHVEMSEDDNDYRIFLNGAPLASLTDASRAANYTGSVLIGSDGASYFDGFMDELRVSSIARHTVQFDPRSSAYTTSSATPIVYIGATRPLDGFKLYVYTENTSTSTMSVSYWDGDSWESVSSLSDGTSAGGKSLAQTGTVTFTSTKDSAKVKSVNGVVLYWYKVSISTVSASASVYHATVSAPMQQIRDIWDGEMRKAFSFQVHTTSTYQEWVMNIYENEYDSSDTSTFVELDSLASTSYLLCGFNERMQGIRFNLFGDHVNSTNCTMSVEYWDGSDWQSVSSLSDGTYTNSDSFGKSGFVTWSPPDAQYEVQKSVDSEMPLYYYKVSFSATLDGDVQLYFVGGIPAQKKISAYKFPIQAHNRLWLCSDQNGYKNSAICSADGSPDVFSGDDVVEMHFGDLNELVAGGALFVQLGSSLYDIAFFAKKTELWGVVGTSPEDFQKYRISDTVGCIAPQTMVTVSIGYDMSQQMLNKHVAIWQGESGIYMFDGRMVIRISDDIANYFDPKNSNSINTAYSDKSVGFYDPVYYEYHWLFASDSSATLDKEMVFDLKRLKWFEIDRGTGMRLQCGFNVRSTDGVPYSYGTTDSGYAYRLEYGDSFDGSVVNGSLSGGNEINYEWMFGDMALMDGQIMNVTSIRNLKLVTMAKENTSASIYVTHYIDGETAGTARATLTASENGKRFRQAKASLNNAKKGVFHSLKFTQSTFNETIGFEPMYLALAYVPERKDL